MTAEQYERSNVPAHDEDRNSNAHDGGTRHIHISQVFGREK